MSLGPSEPSKLGPRGSFCQEKQAGSLGQKIPGAPSPGCSRGLVRTPVWLLVASPGSRAKG